MLRYGTQMIHQESLFFVLPFFFLFNQGLLFQGEWIDIARDTAWKDYGAKTATAANLLKLASDVAA